MRARLNDIKEVAEGEGWARYLDLGDLAAPTGPPAIRR